MKARGRSRSNHPGRTARSALLAALCGSVLGASGAMPTSRTTAPVVSEQDRVEVLAQLLEREDRRVSDAVLIGLSRAPQAPTRARAAMVLGRIGVPDDQPRLLEMLRDPVPSVRRASAFGLGLLQYDLDPASESARRSRAAADLVSRLHDEPEVALAAAWSLGAIGGSRDVLRTWLLQTASAGPEHRPAPEVIAAVIEAWWRQERAEVAPLRGFVGNPDVSVRLAVAHALRRLANPNGWPLLERLLAGPDPEVRVMALRGLRPAPAATAYRLAVPRLRDPDWRVRVEALNWIAQAWAGHQVEVDDQAFTAVLRASLDRGLQVRRAALAALGAVTDRRGVAVDRLLQALGESEASLRATAMRGLTEAESRIQREAFRQASSRLLERGEAAIGASPAEADAFLRLAVRVQADTELMDAFLSSEHIALRVSALALLAERQPGRAAPLAVQWLGQEPLPLRAAAARELLAIASRGSLVQGLRSDVREALWRQLYDLRSADAAPVRRAAFDALAVIDPALLVSRLSLLVKDPDRTIRLRALRLPAAAPRLAEDSTLVRRLWAGRAATRTAEQYRALAARVLEWERNPPVVRITTPRGEMRIRLCPAEAPLTVDHFLSLVRSGHYDTSRFHRVVVPFVAQGGGRDQAPWSWGWWPSEDSLTPYRAGTVGLAHGGRDTGSGQFFLTHSAQPHLTGYYPAFAVLVDGRRTLERIQPDDRMQVVVEPSSHPLP